MRNRYPYVRDVKTIIFIEFSLLGFYFKFKNCNELFEFFFLEKICKRFKWSIKKKLKYNALYCH